MRPSTKFRWVMTNQKDEEGPVSVAVRYWPDVGQPSWKLQQWWEADEVDLLVVSIPSKDGEWRDIPVE